MFLDRLLHLVFGIERGVIDFFPEAAAECAAAAAKGFYRQIGGSQRGVLSVKADVLVADDVGFHADDYIRTLAVDRLITGFAQLVFDHLLRRNHQCRITVGNYRKGVSATATGLRRVFLDTIPDSFCYASAGRQSVVRGDIGNLVVRAIRRGGRI